jgi:signal transduction histidine kinase
MKHVSLRTKMAVMFGLLIAGVAAFMVVIFPERMEVQARASAELRAWTVASVLASGVAPALEFDDGENASKVLASLERMPDARFAVVLADNDTRFATWNPAGAPLHLPAPDTAEVDDDVLVVGSRIVGRNDVHGTLYFGLSLEKMVAERDEARSFVMRASMVVLAVGIFACVVLASALVRPLRKLTLTAEEIARGARPPQIARMTGGLEVEHMSSALGTMLDRLNETNGQLVQASRHAGMAEVATGVLHNVGNTLTSVNVALELVYERVSASPIDRVKRTRDLLEQARSQAGASTIDPDKLDAGLKYLGAIAGHLEAERTTNLSSLTTLRSHVDHIKRVVAMQNAYARTGNVDEIIKLSTLVDEAVALGCPDPSKQGIAIAVDADASAEVAIDRHRVLQILVNLITNAKDAVLANSAPAAPKQITITATARDGWLEARVDDTGTGFLPEQRDKIFSAGFTTKPKGHGYGLHSSALAAEQLGGTLGCSSAGLGRGASFELRVPAKARTESSVIAFPVARSA